MIFPNKDEWSEIVLVGVLGGGFACGIGLLWQLGFDKNAIFTFLGAIVGAAAIVLFSIGQQERQYRRAAVRERDQILSYFRTARLMIDEQVGSPFRRDPEDPLNAVDFVMIVPAIENLRNYTVQAVRYAAYLGFMARANLDGIAEQSERTLAVLRQIVADADNHEGKPDFTSGRRAIVSLHNSMNLLSVSALLES